jgi:ferrous iron transport protein A
MQNMGYVRKIAVIKPGKKGGIETMRSLDQIREGEIVEIVEIRAGKGLHTRLANMGVHLGSRIQVISSYSSGGPIMIAKNGMKLAIGHGMAVKIFVKSVDGSESEL